jgi:hypothetical protein
MAGPMRLFIVAAVAAFAAWWLVPAYLAAFIEAGRQVGERPGQAEALPGQVKRLLRTGSANARPAGDTPRSYRRMECAGSIWSDKLHCGAWQDDEPRGRR